MYGCESIQEAFCQQDGMTILQSSQAARDPMLVARALAAVTGLQLVDVTQAVKKHHGPIILEKLRPVIAEALVSELQQQGLATSAVPTSSLACLRLAGNAAQLEYGAEQLKARLPHRELCLPWSSLTLLSVGWVNVPRPDQPLVSETNLDGLALEHAAEVHGNSRPVLEKQLLADLFYSVPDGYFYLRLLARHLAYFHLGDRLLPSSLENFRTVLCDLCQRAPQLQQSEQCHAFLSGQPLPPSHAFADQAAFDEVNLRQLQLPW